MLVFGRLESTEEVRKEKLKRTLCVGEYSSAREHHKKGEGAGFGHLS